MLTAVQGEKVRRELGRELGQGRELGRRAIDLDHLHLLAQPAKEDVIDAKTHQHGQARDDVLRGCSRPPAQLGPACHRAADKLAPNQERERSSWLTEAER
jgi:hypothetical protein